MSNGCITEIWSGNPAWTQPNFCASLYTSGLIKPRGLHIDTRTDEILLVERGLSRIVRLDNDGTTITPVATGVSGLNHGIELDSSGYIYASTPTTVYRWPYQTGQLMTSGNAQEVIVGMDRTASDELGAPGGHTTRTLAFCPAKMWLYVSIGSLGNVDADSFRSRIRRFYIPAWDGVTPLNFIDGEVFADGLRNEVGLAFDSFGDLWGVENGADRLERDDLGGDIHNDNPSEELNRFREEQAGEHWGYPYCWSEYCLPVANGGSGMKGANTPWAWPSFLNAGTHTDEWCRENTVPSVMSMPAHSAPLGITFYNWREMSQEEYNSSGCTGGFPRSTNRYAFVAFHGSWNRSPPTGYKVVFIPFDDQGNPTALPIDLFRHNGDSAKWPDPLRPVDVQFDSCGRLYVTEDGTGSVIKITYSGGYLDTFLPLEVDVADGASCSPFKLPTSPPTSQPTKKPTNEPSAPPSKTQVITSPPSVSPSKNPTNKPTIGPSESPITISVTTLPPNVSPSKSSTTKPVEPLAPAPTEPPINSSSTTPDLVNSSTNQETNSPTGSPVKRTEAPSVESYAKSWTLKPDSTCCPAPSSAGVLLSSERVIGLMLVFYATMFSMIK